MGDARHGTDNNDNHDTAKDNEGIDYSNPPFPLTTQDRSILSLRDEDFHHITWSDLTQIIATNTLENLLRTPSSLRAYLAWSHRTKTQYGSITNFVIRERLYWTPLPLPPPSPNSSLNAAASSPEFAHISPIPFEDARDFAVLRNDWPYGFAQGIRHLIVWTKTRIPVDDSNGDLTVESRRVINEFIERYFVKDLDSLLSQHNIGKEGEVKGEGEGNRKGKGWEKVTWFKNWTSLQSVRGVDHVHVIVRDVPEAVVEAWTVRRDL